MVVPGYSVTDLIQVLVQVKVVYDAFFSEYANSASQLRELALDIEQFRSNLQQHQEILDERGLQYGGYEAVHRTLEQCRRFLESYREVIDRQRRTSVTGVYRTARFAFNQDEVTRLRGQIARHGENLMQYSINLVLHNSLRSQGTTTTTALASPLPIAGSSNVHASPPSTPRLLGSSLVTRDLHSNRNVSQSLPSSSDPRAFTPSLESSPASAPASVREHSRTYSSSEAIPTTPMTQGGVDRTQSTIALGILPGLVLPQAALPYCVAEVHIGNKKKVNLNRKPAGRDFDGGREMVILDQDGKVRFKHQIKLRPDQSYFPYTWHRRWKESHAQLEVDFTGIPTNAHSVVLKEGPAIKGNPKYFFTREQDFVDFQSELRGKRLCDTFEVRQIRSASSSKAGEATDQHTKIWQDHVTHGCTLSFYASAVPDPYHCELSFTILEQELVRKGTTTIRVKFIVTEPKRSRTFSTAFGRSPTERTGSSSNTAGPDVFSRQNTAMFSGPPSITTIPSRSSVISLQSNPGSSRDIQQTTRMSVESLVKRMKYLDIEFSDDEEASRFKQTYDQLYREEIAYPSDLFMNWQMNAENRRPESLISTSPMGSPLTMSPELHPSRGQASND